MRPSLHPLGRRRRCLDALRAVAVLVNRGFCQIAAILWSLLRGNAVAEGWHSALAFFFVMMSGAMGARSEEGKDDERVQSIRSPPPPLRRPDLLGSARVLDCRPVPPP